MIEWAETWAEWAKAVFHRLSAKLANMRFRVRVKPGARRTAVGGRWGEDALIVAVAAPAVEGKANDAVRRALAEAFGVRRQDVEIVAGERGRDKIVRVEADLAAVLERLLDT